MSLCVIGNFLNVLIASYEQHQCCTWFELFLGLIHHLFDLKSILEIKEIDHFLILCCFKCQSSS